MSVTIQNSTRRRFPLYLSYCTSGAIEDEGYDLDYVVSYTASEGIEYVTSIRGWVEGTVLADLNILLEITSMTSAVSTLQWDTDSQVAGAAATATHPLPPRFAYANDRGKLCHPFYAAIITRETERMCEQQVGILCTICTVPYGGASP